ncbi:LysR family transcriptional regulator [uncultured Thalassolituus sp.]|uniref:LysR family transcriptional regulator n=2 Tax=Thalassolituus TaxID=187492 RepID=UPI002601E9FE|nr:LysR family transcriptional regulator [uncultured Thalassolituus sp.]
MSSLRHLDLNLLKAFDVLMDERSVTRAADRLAVSQPAVSGMMNRLRENFNDPLFIRARRGIVPTPRAEALAGSVKRLLADAEAMLSPGEFDPATAEMILTVAGTDYSMRNILVPLLSVLRQEAPGIQLRMLPIDDTLIETQLERGDIDIALMTEVTAPASCHARALFAEHYLCAMRKGHPLEQALPLSLDAFCAAPQALMSYVDGALSGDTDNALKKLGRSRHVAVSVPNFLVLCEVLHHSDLIAVAPSRIFRNSSGITVSAPPLEIPGFTKTMVWHPRTAHDPAHVWIRERLANLFG